MANDLNVIINLLANSKGLEAGYKSAAIQQVALNRELNRGNAAAVNATRGMDGLQQRTDSLGRTLQSVGRYAATAFGLFAIQNAAAGVKNILADYQDFETRLKFLSGTTEIFTQNMAFLDRLSKEHGKSVLDLGQGYSSVAALIRGGTLDMQQGQAITTGLSNAQSALGATTGQLGLVMYGLGQALSQPNVQAQEFNQVVEPLPGLMQELTKAAGLTTGSYRDLVLAGKLTSAQFRDDLIKALAAYDGAAKANINNIRAQENALVNMRAKAVKAFEEPISNVYGSLLSTTSDGLETLAKNADTVTDALGYLITFGLIRGTAALTNYSVAQGVKIVNNRIEAATSLEAAQSELAKNIQLQASARAQLAAALTSTQHSRANELLIASNAAVAASQTAVNVALGRYAVAGRAAIAVGRGLMAAVGGVPGLLLLGGYALYSYASASDDAATKTDNLKQKVYDLTAAFDGLNNATVRNEINKNTRDAISLGDEIDELARKRQTLFNYRAETDDPRTYQTYTQAIGRLTASINQLTEKRALLLNTNARLANTEENLNNLKWQSVSANNADNASMSAQQALREEQEKQANTLLDNLKRQQALYGDVSHEATIRYELESGKLTVINEQLREKLILEARQLDALKKQKDFQNQFERVAASLKSPLQTEQDTNQSNLGILNQALVQTPESEVEKRNQINLLIQAEELRHNQSMAEIAKKGANDFDAMWNQSFDRFASGIGDATADALFESKNLGDGIRNVLGSVAKQMVSTLVEIGVKRLALAAINSTAATTEAAVATTATVASGTAITAAMAPAAAATTLATAGANGVSSVITIGAVGAAIAAMFAGLFDKGGNIPRGQFGIVGEYGPEIVNGPARITSRADTAKILSQRGNAASGGDVVQITINDNKVINTSGSSDQQLAQLQAALAENNQALVAQIARDIGRGQGPVYNALRRAR